MSPPNCGYIVDVSRLSKICVRIAYGAPIPGNRARSAMREWLIGASKPFPCCTLGSGL